MQQGCWLRLTRVGGRGIDAMLGWQRPSATSIRNSLQATAVERGSEGWAVRYQGMSSTSPAEVAIVAGGDTVSDSSGLSLW